MLQSLKLITIFALSVEKDWRHREEQLSFDPSENLQVYCMRARSLKAAVIRSTPRTGATDFL